MRVSNSIEEARAADQADTVKVATDAGFTEQVEDEGHVLCQKPDTMELVDVYPDGSWEYQNARDDGSMQEMSGSYSNLLAMYLASDENKQLFEDNQGEANAESES